jgi:hypothetical protein
VIAFAPRKSSDAALSALLECHVSDHADEVDGTIAFASRGVDGPAIALQANRNSGPTRSSPAIITRGSRAVAVDGYEQNRARRGRRLLGDLWARVRLRSVIKALVRTGFFASHTVVVVNLLVIGATRAPALSTASLPSINAAR